MLGPKILKIFLILMTNENNMQNRPILHVCKWLSTSILFYIIVKEALIQWVIKNKSCMLDIIYNRSKSGKQMFTISNFRSLNHTMWIWSLVVTQPITGGPKAGDFARVSPNPWFTKG
jgi:hypothetical protein